MGICVELRHLLGCPQLLHWSHQDLLPKLHHIQETMLLDHFKVIYFPQDRPFRGTGKNTFKDCAHCFILQVFLGALVLHHPSQHKDSLILFESCDELYQHEHVVVRRVQEHLWEQKVGCLSRSHLGVESQLLGGSLEHHLEFHQRRLVGKDLSLADFGESTQHHIYIVSLAVVSTGSYHVVIDELLADEAVILFGQFQLGGVFAEVMRWDISQCHSPSDLLRDILPHLKGGHNFEGGSQQLLKVLPVREYPFLLGDQVEVTQQQVGSHLDQHQIRFDLLNRLVHPWDVRG